MAGNQTGRCRVPTHAGDFSQKLDTPCQGILYGGKLSALDAIHGPLFDAIHKERKQIHDDKAIRKFFIRNGVDKGDFKQVYESDEIDTKVKQAFVMAQRYKLTGVPAVIVNGKYLVSGSTAGSFPNVLQVIDQLIGRERANMVGG